MRLPLCMFLMGRNVPALLCGVCICIGARERGIYWFGLPLLQ
jgi:hypothetical protein